MVQRLMLACICVPVLAALAACGQSNSTPATGQTNPATPTAMSISTSWKVYTGPHFSISYPPEWTARLQPQGDNTAAQPDMSYVFTAPGGIQSVTVNERDGADAALIHQACSSSETTVTLAGLQMRYQTDLAQIGRSWTFVSDKGTIYGLITADGHADKDTQNQDDAVLTTFRPEYTTSGCA